MENSLIVTEHGEFYRAIKDDESRYFAPSKREQAFGFDAGGNPVLITGFAVYDTTVSTSYAVALYATFAEAKAHQPVPAATVQESDIAPPVAESKTDRLPKRR